MKIVIDLQSLQTSSRYRGIGHYTLSLIKQIIESNIDDDIILLLNQNEKKYHLEIYEELSYTSKPFQVMLFKFLNENIENSEDNIPRILISELIRNYFIQCISPDFVLISSLFEGASEPFCCSIPKERNYPIGVIGYDLIPLSDESTYLPNKVIKRWYERKLEQLSYSNIIYSISESSRDEFLNYKPLSKKYIYNISSACNEDYKIKYSIDMCKEFYLSKSITKEFVLYSGACDARKNLFSLIDAYGGLDKKIKKNFQLVLVGKYGKEQKKVLLKRARRRKIENSSIIFTDYISNTELNMLYSHCELFVFPSLHEGFGLPVLEAMTCGAPVICSNTSSLPEVIGLTDAMFDPYSVEDIRERMKQALTDMVYREKLLTNSNSQASKFSWVRSAELLVSRAKEIVFPAEEINFVELENELISNIADIVSKYGLTDETIQETASCISINKRYLIDDGN